MTHQNSLFLLTRKQLNRILPSERTENLTKIGGGTERELVSPGEVTNGVTGAHGAFGDL